MKRMLNGVFVALWIIATASFAGALNIGDIDTYTGGGPNNLPAISASLSPISSTVDSAGNLYIAASYRVFKVDTAGTLTVVAGTGSSEFHGDGGLATRASFGPPEGVAVDGSGNLFIADRYYHQILKVDAATGVITIVAGNGSSGFSGDGGPATSASMGDLYDVAVDGSGNLFIADRSNNRIRRVDAVTGVISTVAGNGTGGFSGDGGPATSASLSHPQGVAIDSSGNLFIADRDNGRIRKVNAAGIISTVAGNGLPYYIGNGGDGGPATSAHLSPEDVAVDSSGNLFIADISKARIRKIDAATGIINTVAGSGTGGYSGDGGPATSATLDSPSDVTVDGSGNLFIVDRGNYRIRKVVAATGIISTLAGNGSSSFSGDGIPATSTTLQFPHGVAFDGSGNLFIADSDNNRIRKVDAATGLISTVAGNGTYGFSGDGGPATSASLQYPQRVAFDGSGNLIIADTGNHRIRKVDAATGIIRTLAGDGTHGFSGDGGPATSAGLYNPDGLAIDGSGNIFIADTINQRIRKVDTATGFISTVAGDGAGGFSGDGGPATSASLYYPEGVAFDGSGNLFIADTDNQRIRKVDAATGMISTVAGDGVKRLYGDGGLALSASFYYPYGVAFDASDNLFIVDRSNSRIRKVDAATGNIDTIAGINPSGFFGDGGPATDANLDSPRDVAFDASGNMYIADAGNDRIRIVIGAEPGNTGAGSAVEVLPEDTASGTSPVTLTFAEVSTAGDTTLTTSATGPSPPAGFLLGTPPLYFELNTTASFTGSVEVCIDYSGSSFDNEAGLSLFHEEGGVWVDVTTSLDTVNDIICGEVTSFSPFAVLAANQPPTADAGDDQLVACAGTAGTSVTLDGTGSSDPEGDPLSYTWTGPFPEGAGTVTGINPAVTLPLGTSTVTLIVNDGLADSVPDSVAITVAAQVAGFYAPLSALVPEGDVPIPPDKAFKAGRTLPLKLDLSCGGAPLTEAQLTGAGKPFPKIVSLHKTGDAPLDLETLDLDSGQANDNGLYFRSGPDGSWIYNLKTKGLATGSYEISIEMPDGLRYTGAFVLR